MTKIQRRGVWLGRSFWALLCLVLIPSFASAQITGIAGVVKDTSGAVLPGVTVEAASPALIEKVRTAVTDGQGQYKIVDLRPGVYTVTFTLPGFSMVSLEGINLSASFTATANAELRVGALEESITVSAAGTLVDVHNVVQQRVITNEVIDTLPTSRNFQTLAEVIPGVRQVSINRPSGQDVGGLTGERGTLSVHGGRSTDMMQQLDGLSVSNLDGNGANSNFTINPGEVQEFSYELGALSAESGYGGVRVNMIPKDGGNLFAGYVTGTFSNRSMSSNNLSADLVNRGLRSVNREKVLWDLNPSYGGPIKSSKLWFFGSFRYSGLHDQVAGLFYDKNPKDFVPEPDLSRPAIEETWLVMGGVRLTWQASRANKISLYLADQPGCQCENQISALRSPEASLHRFVPFVNLGHLSWKSTIGSRLLLDAGTLIEGYGFWPTPQEGVTSDILSTTELTTGFVYRAAPNYGTSRQTLRNFKASLSYVTGSHAFKAGADYTNGVRRNNTIVNGDMTLQLSGGVPRQVTVFNTPRLTEEHLQLLLGLYVQDQWTFKRMTLNGGLRFDALRSGVPALHLSAGTFVPARDFAPVSNVPNWRDLGPIRRGLRSVWQWQDGGESHAEPVRAPRQSQHRDCEQPAQHDRCFCHADVDGLRQ